MGLYLGDSKIKLSIDIGTCHLNIFSSNDLIVTGVALKSSDDYSLKDSNDVRLFATKGDE